MDHHPKSVSPNTNSSNINNNNSNNERDDTTTNPASLLPLTEEEVDRFVPVLGGNQWFWANVDRTAIFVFFWRWERVVPYWLEKKEATIVFTQHPLVAEIDQILSNYEALNVQKF